MTSFPETIRDLWDLLRRYADQELYQPLRNLPGYVGLGLGGAVLAATGAFLLALGGLRLVQTELPRQLDGTGDSSPAPYLILFVACLLAVGALAARAGKARGGSS